MSDDRLAGGHVNRTIARCNAEHTAKDDCVFVELRHLGGLDPARRTLHARNAERLGPRVHAADKLLNSLRLITGGLNNGGCGDECRHGIVISLEPSVPVGYWPAEKPAAGRRLITDFECR